RCGSEVRLPLGTSRRKSLQEIPGQPRRSPPAISASRRGATTGPMSAPAPALVTAAVQMCSTDDFAANLAAVRRLVADAAAGGARLIVLPECFAFLGRAERDKMAVAESLDGAPGPILGALAELATRHGVFIVGGGMPELERSSDSPGAASQRAYNTAVVVS